MEQVEISGNCEQIQELLAIAERVAKTDATVLLTGESGTGKELFAKYIQENSSRKDAVFLSINCAAIPSNLLENEFFGHKKGAFTDAVDDYQGKFGFANSGTIFLDEIGEMDLVLQAKLLRFLQYKVYHPVGSNEEYKADVRIIAATNKDLLKLVAEKKFREDLYYRLNVVPIKLPPLRDRKNDILLLTDYFVEKFSNKYGKRIKGVDIEVKKKFLTYNWTGNVRELQNVIERAVVLTENDIIKMTDTDFIFGGYSNESSQELKSLKIAVEEYKKEYIVYALNLNNWNQTKTARVLNIQRTYLARLIKQLNISKL